MRQFYKQRFAIWLQRRIPAGREQTLSHKKIFILPSRFGTWFLVMCAVLFVLGTNYQNNLMKLLCTFLLSLFLLHLFASYINFSRLKIKALIGVPSFAETPGQLPIWIGSQNKKAQGIVHMSWWNSALSDTIAVKVHADACTAAMPFTFTKRGTHRLGRLTLRCDYPLGLFKCWTHLDLDQSVIIYPKPKACKIALHTHESSSSDKQMSKRGGKDEFYGLKDFHVSDSLSSVAWKHVAKSEQWRVKTFEEPLASSGWLTLHSSQASDIEIVLQELSYQIINLGAENKTFGLSLPGIQVEPNSGAQHQQDCLTALANYPTHLGPTT